VGASSDRVVYHGLAGPVELAVVDVAAALEEVAEHAAQLVVVGRLEEVQPPHVAQVRRQLLGVPFAQHLRNTHIFFNFLVEEDIYRRQLG
jgi:hypothetical protein